MPSREKQANNYVRGINIVVQFLKSFKRLPIVDTVLAVVQDFVIFASLKKILQRLDLCYVWKGTFKSTLLSNYEQICFYKS